MHERRRNSVINDVLTMNPTCSYHLWPIEDYMLAHHFIKFVTRMQSHQALRKEIRINTVCWLMYTPLYDLGNCYNDVHVVNCQRQKSLKFAAHTWLHIGPKITANYSRLWKSQTRIQGCDAKVKGPTQSFFYEISDANCVALSWQQQWQSRLALFITIAPAINSLVYTHQCLTEWYETLLYLTLFTSLFHY
jgi:hypothetical protein